MTDSIIVEPPFALPLQRMPDTYETERATPLLRRLAVLKPAEYRTSIKAKLIPLTFGIAVAASLWIGWHNRDDNGLTPESGVGYWLGIAGSGFMLLLLLHPLRKRWPSLRVIGSVPFWFRAHMVLGIWGCVLVLWHANFTLGSINSNAALCAMLVVAASGLVGRYLYSKIHRGLYGSKAAVEEILADAGALQASIGAGVPMSDYAIAQLNAFARLGMAAPSGVFTGLMRLPVIAFQGSLVRMRLIAAARQAITHEGNHLGWSRAMRRRKLADSSELATLYVAVIKKAAAFALYERLFRIWHIFHMPLFFLLVIAAIVHVYAAHFF